MQYEASNHGPNPTLDRNPPVWHFERDPIPYALETDWPVGAAGFEPLHIESEFAKTLNPGGQDSNLRISN